MDNSISDPTSQKQCSQCKQPKPRSKSFFSPNKKNKDGLHSICKQCRNNKAKADRLAKRPPELPPPPIGYKRCRTCKQVKPAMTQFFNAIPSYKSEDCLSNQCIDCRKNYRKNLHANGPKEVRPQSERKRCKGPCKRMLPTTLNFYSYNRATKDRLNTVCKNCSNVASKNYRSRPGGRKARQAYRKARSEHDKNYRREYRILHWEHEQAYRKWYNETHKELIKARTSAYTRSEHGRAVKLAATHRRLARKRNVPGTHTPQQIQELLKKQHYHCYYCGKKFEKKNGKYIFHRDHTFPLNRENSSNDISLIVLTCPPCNLSKGDRYPWEWVQGGRLL